MKKVLITGSEGLIGKKLVKLYKDRGHEVFEYDWANPNLLDLPQEHFDVIHHCASQCIIRDVIKIPEQSFQNILITHQIMELARKHPPKKLFLYSSNRVTNSEENPYVTSKKHMENFAKAYKNCYDIDSIIIRPETIWGYKEADIRVIPAWIENTIQDKEIIIYGDKEKELSPLYVDDFISMVEGMEAFYNNYKNETWTITGQPKLANQIAIFIRDYLKKDYNIKFYPAEKTQPQKCESRINEHRVLGDFSDDIRRYLEERKTKK